MTGTPSVAVAGGGIGGLAAAVALAGRGLRVTVLERSGRLGAVGSGLVLYPNGMRAVDALGHGLGERVRAAGHTVGPSEERVIMDDRGTVLAREPIGTPGGGTDACQVSLLRTALQRELAAAAGAAGAQVRLGTEVRGYATEESGVRVALAGGGTLHCDALVAADGIRSAVRRQLHGDGPPLYRGYTSVRGRSPHGALGQRSHVVNGQGIQLFIAPVGGGELYWAAKITAEPGTWPAKGPKEALGALLRRVGDWHEPVARLIREADPEDIAVTDIHDRDPVDRWTDGRVALLGDAAHPMVPALGQGANLAIEDAVVLAEALAGYRDVPDALARYQARRAERAAMVVLRSRAQGALDQGDGEDGAAHRDRTMTSSGRKDADLGDVHAWRPGTGTADPVPADAG